VRSRLAPILLVQHQNDALGSGCGEALLRYFIGSFDAAGPQVRSNALVACSSKLGGSLVEGEEGERTFGGPRLARLFDMGLALAALAQVLVVWASGGTSPLWYSVLNGLWGLFFGYVALRALRSGESPFFSLARYLTPERDTAQPAGAEEAAWGTWLNSRVPDEEDQRALKRYLDQRYPGSRSRSVLYALTVGGSLWLVAQSVGGAVEWLVGRGLERMFGQ
jgi:hypothetical protein